VSERLLTAAQVAERLGFSANTILDWFEAGKLTGVKFGPRGRVRFRELSDVDAFIGKCTIGPGRGGDVLPTPSALPTRGVALQALPTPNLGGDDAC
jgi:excisionase family DNA binding protein